MPLLWLGIVEAGWLAGFAAALAKCSVGWSQHSSSRSSTDLLTGTPLWGGAATAAQEQEQEQQVLQSTFLSGCRPLLRRHSFVVDAASCRLGPYLMEVDDPFPQAGFGRPVLAFFGGGVVSVVQLSSRPVAARFRWGGCSRAGEAPPVVAGVGARGWVSAEQGLG